MTENAAISLLDEIAWAMSGVAKSNWPFVPASRKSRLREQAQAAYDVVTKAQAKEPEQNGSKPSRPDADGWQKWEGGECPVPIHHMVEVKFGGGEQLKTTAGDVWWGRVAKGYGIIAWRLASADEDKVVSAHESNLSSRETAINALTEIATGDPAHYTAYERIEAAKTLLGLSSKQDERD